MTQRARLYIAAVIACGGGVLMLAALATGWRSRDAVVLCGVAAGAMIAERFVIHLPLREQTVSFSLVEIPITFALFQLPGGAVVVAAAGGMLGAQLLRRRPLVKAAFNAGMYALAALAAVAVFTSLRAADLQDLRSYLAAGAAMGAFFLANKVLVSLVLSLVEGQRFGNIMAQLAGVIIAIWGGNVALGLLAVRLHVADRSALPLLIIPAGLAFAAYRASVRSRVESRKMNDLYVAGSALITSLESSETFDLFLERTRDLFRASGAEIILVERPRELRIFRDGVPSERLPLPAPIITERDVLETLDRTIESRGWRSSLTAPIASGGDIKGILAVYDRRGAEGPESFPPRERDLIRLLANELSIRIRNMRLFQSVSEERSKLADIIDHTTDGIYQTNSDRRIISWNPAMETITGYRSEEAVGQYCFNVLRARDDKGVDLCSVDCPILECCASASHQEREAEIMTKDGEARWISYGHSPVRNAEGVVISDVVVVRDVTEQRRVREMQEDFLSTVSHELRTPLTPLKGFLLTLMRNDQRLDEDEIENIYARMLHQAERLEDLVNDLLVIANMESAGMVMSRERLDLEAIVGRTVDAFEATYPRRSFALSAKPGICAIGDDRRLEHVVANLLQNAVRYAPENEPIEVAIEEIDGEARIEVLDHGPGIPVREQQRIFDRFYRGGDHLTRDQQGAGLGLYIVRRFIEAMGGRIALSSKLGEGSSFVVHLPTATASTGTFPRPAV